MTRKTKSPTGPPPTTLDVPAQDAPTPLEQAHTSVGNGERRRPRRGHSASGRATRARTAAARVTGKALLTLRGHDILKLPPKVQATRTVLAKIAFLREFATCGIILHAARAAGVGRQTVQDWRRADPAFVDLMTNAHEDAMDLLEEEARRRGHDGVVEPVFQGGKEVGSIRRYSDHLLMMFLKGKRRDQFSERVEQTGAGGAPLAPAVVLVSWHHSMKPPEQP